MSKSDTFEYELLSFIFQSCTTTWGATAGTTDLWVGLHTADPTDSASTAAEGGYAQYTRIAVSRNVASWSLSSDPGAGSANVSPAASIDFPQNTSTSTGTFTHASVWLSSNAPSSGCLYSGTVTPNINFSQNVTPRLTTGSSITED